MLVCHCAVVNDRRIREAITSGATDLTMVAAACGAGSFCGGCRPSIVALLADITGRSPTELEPAGGEAPGPGRQPFRAVTRALEEDVLGSGWPSGRLLPAAADLAQRYGCTTGTLERAVWVLEQHGIVVREGDRPVRLTVGEPSARAIAEAAALHLASAGATGAQVLDVRRVIEEAVVRSAAARANDGRLSQRLRDWLDREPSDDRSDSIEFHVAVAEAAGNPALRILSETLVEVARLRVVVGPDMHAAEPSSGRAGATVEEVREAHRRTAEALLGGDSDLAAALMREHLEALQGRHVSEGWWLDQPAEGRRSPASVFALACEVVADIRRRALVPGDIVGTRRALLGRLGVPRETLRHAVTLLEYYAAVHARPGPDASVTVMAPDAWPAAQLVALYLDRATPTNDQLFDVRMAIEPQAAARAAASVTSDGTVLLERRLDEETHLRARLGGDRPGYYDVHTVIADVSGDPVLRLFVYALKLVGVRRALQWGPVSAGGDYVRRLADDHDAVVRAIVAGNGEAAGRGMREHLDWMRARLTSP